MSSECKALLLGYRPKSLIVYCYFANGLVKPAFFLVPTTVPLAAFLFPLCVVTFPFSLRGSI